MRVSSILAKKDHATACFVPRMCYICGTWRGNGAEPHPRKEHDMKTYTTDALILENTINGQIAWAGVADYVEDALEAHNRDVGYEPGDPDGLQEENVCAHWLESDRIEALRDEAGAAGDSAQVAICDRALEGDREALAECARVIALAMQQELEQ